MAALFVRRPVLASVLSISLSILGLLALLRLPMALFPQIAPPEVNVTVEYTGANAETVTRAAVVPLERAINGVPGMKYMSSDAGNDGVGVVQILFETGTDPDVAAINVQNRVNEVMGRLPPEVIRNGVKIKKEENAILLYLSLHSSAPEHDEKFLYNFADINILAELKRIPGVGFADIMGAKEYAMRVWLRPEKLARLGLSTDEVIEAIEASNVEAAPGKVGDNSDKGATPLQYTLTYRGKFNSEAEYRALPLRAGADGALVRLGDVADIEFGTSYFDVEAKFNGKPAASILLKQLPGSNAAAVIEAVRQRLVTLEAEVFLPGMRVDTSFDVSRFLDAAVFEVVRTLLEAFLLVALVVLLFLQSARTTLVPILAVPVSLIGTLLFVQLFGFSLNLITLFALVLAIGIVVDNAIVIVEAVHHKIHHDRLSPGPASEATMRELTPAIIAITLVMGSVFVPLAFLSGPAGVFYRQFGLTMAVAIFLSGFVALTLTPALSALLLPPHDAPRSQSALARAQRSAFAAFDRAYAGVERGFVAVASLLGRRAWLGWLAILACVVGTAAVAARVPSGFIPVEDQGMFYVSVTLPPGATLERTKEAVAAIRAIAQGLEAVESVATLAGANILSDGTGATYGTCIVNLVPWKERSRSVDAVIAELEAKVGHIQAADIEAFPPPSIPGYGNASGFEARLLDKTGRDDLTETGAVLERFVAALQARPEIASAFSIFNANYPQIALNVDYDRAARLGVDVEDAMSTLQTLVGSEYVSNFIRFGQMYKVMLQAPPESRATPEQLLLLQVRSRGGDLVPLSAFITLDRTYGVDQATRYNMYPSAELNGEGAPGVSSGRVLAVVQEVADATLPRGFAIDWAGISLDEVQAGNQGVVVGAIALLFVFLVLAAQYESFTLPLVVLLSLPPGVLGAFALLKVAGLENNIFTHIALVVLIGLLGKNAILIVEFAEHRRREGVPALAAVVEATRLRLRPVLMTSLAFVAGLVPLALSSGAGAVANRTIGVATIGGMVLGTLLGIVVIPPLYVSVRRQRGASSGAVPAAAAVALLTLALLGCAPALTPPQVRAIELPTRFQRAEPAALGDAVDPPEPPTASALGWRQLFANPQLASLIDIGLSQSFDLQLAAQRVATARAAILAAAGVRLPTLEAGIEPTVRKFGTYTMDGAGNATTDIRPGLPVPVVLPDLFVGVRASWEADLWGKLRDGQSAAVARADAAAFTVTLLATQLIADVATAYFELLAQDQTLDVLDRALAQQRQALEWARLQKRSGRVTELAVRQFEVRVLQTRALRQELVQQQRALEIGLNLRIGRLPQPISRSAAAWHSAPADAIALGVPSDLLRARPDIRAAEAEVRAAHLDLRAARAAFYPTLSITASFGAQAFSPAYLLSTPASIAFGAGAGLFAPLVNRRAIAAAFAGAGAAEVEAMVRYQATVLTAFVEVQAALLQLEQAGARLALHDERKRAAEAMITASQALFLAGRASSLEVLNAQEAILEAELDLIASRRDQLVATVQLYRALGRPSG